MSILSKVFTGWLGLAFICGVNAWIASEGNSPLSKGQLHALYGVCFFLFLLGVSILYLAATNSDQHQDEEPMTNKRRDPA